MPRAPRNLDLEALRVWIAAHCGLNPHAAGPLDPDAKLVADRDKLKATVAGLRDNLERSKAFASRVRNPERRASGGTGRG
jgi:hypothetical protein